MHPLMRIWAITALCAAVLLAARGAWTAAFAVFLLSPAPALALFRDRVDQQRWSASWLGFVALGLIGVAVALAVVVHLGGVPQVHEWRAALAPAAR